MTLERGSTLGPYEILGPLGEGGMGEVYRARDTRLGRDVALKIVPAAVASDPDRTARFDREARTIAALNHPNIVTLYSFEEGRGVRFMTMEVVEGARLDQLAADGALSPSRLLGLSIQLTEALAAAHDKGVVHRDLKPANVMVTADDRVKVLDFGVSKLLSLEEPVALDSQAGTRDDPLTVEGQLVGTLPYMAPEQVQGQDVDGRTDIFALGIILYELLTGRRPFVGRTAVELGASILRDAPPPVTSVRADLPADMRLVVERCLEKDPARRFQKAGELRGELERIRLELERAAQAPGEIGVAPPAERPPAQPRDRASIAVLPFDNLSGDAEQDYFADGIVEEIITGLSRIKWLFVISRNSTFIYKGKVVDVTTVGRDLGVRYVMRGSVRRSGDQVRLTGQLTEAETALHVWAGRCDGTLDDVFALQDEMTMSVIAAVEPSLRKAEVERARRKRPGSLDAYDLFLRALPLASTAMPEHAERALEVLEQAIRLEPDYALAHGLIAWCHEQRYLRAGLRAEVRETALRHAHAAIEAGGDDAMALAMGGFVVGALAKDYDLALDALDRSLALSPSSALAFGFSSIVRGWIGDYDTAIEHARTGIRLGPYDPLIYLPYVGLARAHFFSGAFAEAASAAARASAANPRFSVPRYLHAAALARLGRMEEAKAVAQVVLELQPGFTIRGLISENLTTQERMATLVASLREAGLPE